ncbi:MAG: hypothetical protein LBT08_01990, partial [Synergistaceae bacterium]|jgi:hypothetical protein|nr:hypothetical protein [Synergistaceae bacterium]
MMPQTPWSAQLNRSFYLAPKLDDVRVKLTCVSDGKIWEFSKENNAYSKEGRYFNVDLRLQVGDEQTRPTIIFRPEGIEHYIGEYQVSISGIRNAGGANTTLEYSVNFFDMNFTLDPQKDITN